MDAALRQHIRSNMPQLNKRVAEGFAVSQIPQAEEYINEIFKSIVMSFPAGLEYLGGERCTPREEFYESTKPRTNRSLKKTSKSTYDIAPSNVYLMKYKFRFKGQELPPRFLYLPYVQDGGFITISGSRYTIAPVLADRVIQVLKKSLFVRMFKTRFNVYRKLQIIRVDGKERQIQIAWSKIYQKKDVTREDTALSHYLFCKYGVVDTFQRFANCTPVVGDDRTITDDIYTPDKWHIVTTTRTAETGPVPKRAKDPTYVATALRIAIKRSEMTETVERLLGGFFYIADFLPEQLATLPQFVNEADPQKKEAALRHEKINWMTVLGNFISREQRSYGRLLKEMEDHLRSLDDYLDPIVKSQLEGVGFNVNNVYEFFALLTDRFTELLLSKSRTLSSMYDKELNVLYYVLREIANDIVNLGFKMLKLCDNPNLQYNTVDDILKKSIRPATILKLYRNVGSVSAESYPGDNKAMKITTLLTPQQATNKKTNGARGGTQLDDPINRIHSSVAEVGGAFNLPKTQPSGHYRINCFVKVGPDNVIMRNENMRELMDRTQYLLDL